MLDTDKFALDFVTNPSNHYLAQDNRLVYNERVEFLPHDLTLYRIEEITFEEKSPRKKALENVISSMRIDGVNFVYLILGDKKGVHFYFGAVKDLYENKDLGLCVMDTGKYILEPSIRGNFRGSKISKVDPSLKEVIVDRINSMKYFSLLEGVPGISEDSENFQGVDRLVDVMLGDEFGLMIIAKPLNYQDVNEIEKNLYDLYSGLIPFVKKSIQEGESLGTGSSTTKTSGKSDTTGESYSEQHQEGNGNNQGTSTGTNKSTQKSTAKTSGNTSNSTSTTESNSGTEGSNSSESRGTSVSKSDSITKGNSTSINTSTSIAEGVSTSNNRSNNMTLEFVNKEAQDWVKYLDEAIIPRMDYGKGKGIFVLTTCLFSQSKASLIKLENTMMALYSGDKGNKVPLRAVKLGNKDKQIEALKQFQIPCGTIKKDMKQNELIARSALSQCINKEFRVHVGNWISSNELSLIAGLPQKEIVGLGLREEVEFGLNFSAELEDGAGIHLGHLVQSGHILDSIDVFLDKDNLDKHIFVTGVTGSGKTTTCQKLLIDSNLPFLVIEPAKTEYRILTREYDGLLIFTLGKDTAAPFRLNPFEFFKHESITSRVDMITASIEASFDMEAAIPQIIETAVYECYKDYGWNIASNKNGNYDDPFADGVYSFPTLDDLIKKIKLVVIKQGFDEKLKNDYIGSIKARLQGLMVGSKGLMLNTKRSLNFESLLDERVVLELDEVRSAGEKTLIMGFILANLIEAIKAKYQKSGPLRHITLVEEAHRLLSRFMPGDSQSKRQGIEAFTDMLAEIRKYGESLIIVDQIPDKLTPEVLKNTNTKIVHRLFAQDDKDAIGNTMALTDEQKGFLSNLETGRAIVFTQGWSKAVQVQIDKTTDTNGKEMVTDDQLRKNILEFYRKSYKRGVFQGIENFKEMPDINEFEAYMEFIREELAERYKSIFKDLTIEQPLINSLKEMSSKYGVDILTKYLVYKFYIEKGWCSLSERKRLVKGFIRDILNGEAESKINDYDNKLNIGRL